MVAGVTGTSASLLDEELTASRRRLLDCLEGGIRHPEQIEALALADLGSKRAVLALTNQRLGFAWELGFSPTRRFLDRGSIESEFDGADLVVRDGEQLWRYKRVSPPGRAAEIVERLSHGVPAASRPTRPTPQAPPSRSARVLRALAAVGLACFALFLLVGVLASIFGIR
jgi:hypothetical protein